MRAIITRLVVLLACLGWPLQQASLAQTPAGLQVSELSIKAAYLYKFASYVEWPPEKHLDPQTPFNIGVLESESVADELTRITVGRTINERSIRVRKIVEGESLEGLDVLYVGERDKKRLDQLLLPARRLPILTVTESEGAMSEGSVINFTTAKQRVRFEVSLNAAEECRLKLSSRLLAVAERVHRTAE